MKPGAPLIFASLAALFLGAGAFFSPVLLFIWTTFCLILLPFIIIDGLLLFFWTDRLSVTRKINPVLSLGCPAPVNLTVTKTGKGMTPSGFSIFDIFDDSMNTETLPIIVKKSGFAGKTEGEGSIFEYQVTPFERGRWEFLSCELLLNSFLRFWRLKVTHSTKNSGFTYPDFSNIASEKSLRGLLQDSGEKTLRRRGSGIEYLGLRDFQTGDSVRAIDWRATSRRQKPIVREYQDDQDQNVLLLLDSGYRLHRRDISAGNDVLQFDCALNAALLLAYTVLKHGDSVSAGVFGNEERWLPPRKGKAAFPSLMNGLFDVISAGSPSSPFAALENAASKLKRRTFIVMISNFQKEDEEQISWILPAISRYHLLLMVGLREAEAERLAASLPSAKHSRFDNEEYLTACAAKMYLSKRDSLFKKWERSGLLTLETTAAGLSTDLINRYLSVKRAGLL